MEEKEYAFCLRCHRKLKNEKAKKIGYGVVCHRKVKNTGIQTTLFETQPVAKDENM